MEESVAQQVADPAEVAKKTVEAPKNGAGSAQPTAETAKPTAEAAKGDGKEAAPVNFLIWKDEKLPCVVRAAVFQKGLAAGVGIKSQDDKFMATLLRDPVEGGLILDLIRQQVNAELARRGVSAGIIEEEVLGAIDDFVKSVKAGSGLMGTRKVAEGQPPQPGVNGQLVYLLNPNGLPLHRMLPSDRRAAAAKIHRIKPGDVLVEHQPPEPGTEYRRCRRSRRMK
jgi:hypothetical protein